MSTELQRGEFTNPATGEVLDLTSPTPDLGRFLADIRELEGILREHKLAVSREINARFDKLARWTHHFDGLKITGQSPAPVEEWDGAELRAALLELVDAGELAIEAVDAAVETVVTYKPRKSGITALRKIGGRVAATVDGLCRVGERERRVTVTRG